MSYPIAASARTGRPDAAACRQDPAAEPHPEVPNPVLGHSFEDCSRIASPSSDIGVGRRPSGVL